MKFSPGKLISRKTLKKNGKEIRVIFRFPKMSDAKDRMKIHNSIINGGGFLSTGKIKNISEERKMLKNMLFQNKLGNAFSIVSEINGRAVSSSGFTACNGKAIKHVAELGILIAKEYRGIGLGKILMKMMTDEAKKRKLKILMLHVTDKNKVAINLYKKSGFKITGRIPKGRKFRGRYYDGLIMVKKL